MKLDKKKVLVTEGGSGYGMGIALVLKKAGADVWITGRNANVMSRPDKEQCNETNIGRS